jgi:hypothetical protein
VFENKPEQPEVRRTRYLKKAKELLSRAETAQTDVIRSEFRRIAAQYERMAEQLAL